MKLTQGTYTIFDFETTGLFAGVDKICEIGALRCDPDGEGKKFEQLVDPMRPLSERAYELNQISQDMLKGQPTIDEILQDFMKFIEGSVLLAYNARFDISFMAAALGKDRTILNDYQVIDVLELARRCFEVPGRYNLGNVAAHLGVKQDVEHRAMSDVISTWKVFKKAIPILGDRGVKNVEDISRIYEQSKAPVPDAEGPIADLISSAIQSKLPLKIRYRSSWKANVTERTITPIKIQGEYVFSYCHLRHGNRTFIIDCIESAEF
ncbi:MAG: exonuclease domain-containing protein [Candidatus Tantalella remota]|nr:exonuclease domain-containing protein [Candidatus Tantalella remota]